MVGESEIRVETGCGRRCPEFHEASKQASEGLKKAFLEEKGKALRQNEFARFEEEKASQCDQQQTRKW